jgi:ribosomal protein S18 acetylase RimI-like enzyme
MAPALAHLQRTDPRGFHVAVTGGRVVAFAATIVRGNTHFLSMFWTLPGLQSKGVGRQVLTRAFEGPRPAASAVRCVFASLDTRAQMLYLKFGMRPRGMFYLLKGTPNGSPRPRRAVELEQVGKPGKATAPMLAIAARFDRTFRGTRRDADIRYVMSLPGARFFVARADRKTVGYAIVNEKGRVGPAGVVDPAYSAGLAWAIKEAAREMKARILSSSCRARTPGRSARSSIRDSRPSSSAPGCRRSRWARSTATCWRAGCCSSSPVAASWAGMCSRHERLRRCDAAQRDVESARSSLSGVGLEFSWRAADENLVSGHDPARTRPREPAQPPHAVSRRIVPPSEGLLVISGARQPSRPDEHRGLECSRHAV